MREILRFDRCRSVIEHTSHIPLVPDASRFGEHRENESEVIDYSEVSDFTGKIIARSRTAQAQAGKLVTEARETCEKSRRTRMRALRMMNHSRTTRSGRKI